MSLCFETPCKCFFFKYQNLFLGSLIGGIKETQEVIDLCFKHGIYPDCKTVEAKDIDSCWEKLQNTNADGIRFVIDIKKSLENKDYLPK